MEISYVNQKEIACKLDLRETSGFIEFIAHCLLSDPGRGSIYIFPDFFAIKDRSALVNIVNFYYQK